MAIYTTSLPSGLFPEANRYASLQTTGHATLREAGRSNSFPYSERHLQCVWYDPALRPRNLRTTTGEQLHVDHPGTWNLEEGPDFLNAQLSIGPDHRHIQGDVEIHIRTADWKSHGHHKDPRYSKVRVHVTHFKGTPDPSLFPPGTLQVPLKDALQQNPWFSFDGLDLTAYPYPARTGTTPCSACLKNWDPEEKQALLDAAGQERLRRKSEILANAIDGKGPTQVLYEELMCALGYKHNKESFRMLAERVPIARLRATAEGDQDIAYAILMGVAGLLPHKTQQKWDRTTRVAFRKWWDIWWRTKEQWESVMMSPSVWKRSGLRPVNHPARRLMAAAELFTRAASPDERITYLGQTHAQTFAQDASHWLETMSNTYWDRRLSFNKPPQKRVTALLGQTRAASIVSNVLIPFLAAIDTKEVFDAGILSALPSEASNALVRQTAHILFGPDHNETLYATGLRTQGLLQILQDFCMNDRSHCTNCPLPKALKRYKQI